MAVQSDGKVIAIGRITVDDEIAYAIVRYNSDGIADPTFSGDTMDCDGSRFIDDA
jgi:hypothetical protein